MAKRGKTYRTASGKNVDFGALLLANETAPAIGNMNVNARGDEIDAEGNITKSREDIMREYNELNTMIPTDDGVPEGTNVATADDDWQDWEPSVPERKVQIAETTNISVAETPVEETKPATPTGGLAAAVAAAKKNTEE
tara:strand:- start:1156 stop:1572 length:417 start_codon:yes stop_codon:yes gene_type:complete